MWESYNHIIHDTCFVDLSTDYVSILLLVLFSIILNKNKEKSYQMQRWRTVSWGQNYQVGEVGGYFIYYMRTHENSIY